MSAKLSVDLMGINSVIERWCRVDREYTPMHPLERLRLVRSGAVVGGGTSGIRDDLAAFDALFGKSPEPYRVIVNLIYRHKVPMTAIATRMAVSRATVYRKWNAALCFYKAAMAEKGFRL